VTGRQCDACEQDVHCFGATRCACCRREPEAESGKMLGEFQPAVRFDRGGWLSGPCLPVPAFPAAARWPAIARLMLHTEQWLVAWRGPWWSAEQVTGSKIRYVCGHSLDELADAIERAEARP